MTFGWQRCVNTAVLLGVATLTASCGETVVARPQLLIFVDTNAPLTANAPQGQLAVDTLRVDLIASDGTVADFLDVVAPEPDDWPLSFGVVPDDVEGAPSLIRLRLFGGAHAHSGENQGLSTIEPEPTLTLDRLIAVPFPARGIRKVGVLMDFDCVGSPASFAEVPPVSCRSGNAARVGPDETFIDLVEDWTETHADSWEGASDAPCRGTPPEGAVCIPGGAGVLGETQLAAPLTDGIAPAYPLVPVVMTPFFMDRTEFTVGRLRNLVERGVYSGAMPELHDAEHSVNVLCTWLGPEDAAHDDLPVNCLPPTAAEAVCRAESGRLPSEARWEYAARGRGAGWLFPWGNAFPECCSASSSRLGAQSTSACPGWWLSSVGSYSDPDACDGPVDRTPDGVLDLGGSLAEATLDAWVPYGTECWSDPGLRRDPECPVDTGFVVRRGGDWSAGMGLARSSLRSRHFANLGNATLGFRCVYEDSP